MSPVLARSALLLLCCVSAAVATTSSSSNQTHSHVRGPARLLSSRPHAKLSAAAQQFLADYYAGRLRPEKPAADVVVTSAVGAQQYPWAKPEWGQYRQRAVVATDPAGLGGGLTIWAWDIVPEAAVQQANLVLKAVLAEMNSATRTRLLTTSPPSKVSLFNRPEQVWTDIPEHSIFKGQAVADYELSGVGGTKQVPVTSCDSRNVLETEEDPYWSESVLVHEFGHHIHLVALPDCVYEASTKAYNSAANSGAYTPGIYMIGDVYEYMAGAVSAWFQSTARLEDYDGIISRPRLLAKDPTLFNLLLNIFTASVKRFNFRDVCPNCNSKWAAAQDVQFVERGAPAPLIKLGLEACASPANNWQPATYTAPGCTDLQQDCRARAIAAQCESRPDMLTQCQASCGLCRLTRSQPNCSDRDASCYVAANIQGKCSSDPAGMGPQGLGCLASCDTCTSPPTTDVHCGTCASRLCTANQGCCLRPDGNMLSSMQVCSCNSTRGMEPILASDPNNPGSLLPYCKWALRLESDRYTLPAGAIVALPYRVVSASTGSWPHTLSSVCPTQGQRVFPGSRGQNPVGVSLRVQRIMPATLDCPASASLAWAAGYTRLWEASGVPLGESCRNGMGRLVLNATLPRGATAGSCWRVVLQLTDGVRRQLTVKFV